MRFSFSFSDLSVFTCDFEDESFVVTEPIEEEKNFKW